MVSQMPAKRLWWTSPVLWLVLALATTIPIFITDVPPMGDLLNHMARYYIFLNIDQSPFLQRYYDVHWQLVGNLGVDIIVRAIAPFLGVELATRVAVGIIPPLMVAGIYSVSRALNGEVAPSALVTLPLVYNWPFINGMVNFSLSAAMALLILAFWIRMRALGFVMRLLIFAPLGFVTWVAHAAGFGLLGLGVFGFEVVRAFRLRGPNLRSLLIAALATFPFALTILFMFFASFWYIGASGPLEVHFFGSGSGLWQGKFRPLASIFEEEYKFWDVACLPLFLALTIASFFTGGRRINVIGALIAILYALAFALCPFQISKSYWFADQRLLPYAMIFVPLSVGVTDGALTKVKVRRALSLVAVGAIVFFAARLAITTSIWDRSEQLITRHLALFEQIPHRSRVFGLRVESCNKRWPRTERLASLQPFALIVRRESVANGLFHGTGLSQLEVRLDGFDTYPVVRSDTCPVIYRGTLQTAIARFPHDRFDYVWLVASDPLPAFDTHGLRLIGSSGNDWLYQVTAD